jgi:hypothetical protein
VDVERLITDEAAAWDRLLEAWEWFEGSGPLHHAEHVERSGGLARPVSRAA